ncbi:amino acid adenylation domain-containing protein [Microbulbifer sp. S227A]|uniref:amino acid adenylation domain-containing protein n=1 Tax=Microbulbifer sp. S227A TaxID=3415131 RepID=UPI003C7DE3C0
MTDDLHHPRPLCEAQAGIWFAQQRDRANPMLMTGQALHVRGPLEADLLARAVEQLGREADCLSMRLREGPQGPEHWIAPEGAPRLVIRDRTGIPAREVQDQVLAEARGAPPDPGTGPIAGFTLWRLAPDHHILSERIHHVAADGQAMVSMTQRLAALYNAQCAGTEPGPPLTSYRNALDEDARFADAPARARQQGYWHNALADLPDVESMSRGPAGGAGRWFHRAEQRLPDDVGAALVQLAAAAGCNWTDVLTALTGAYVARHLPGVASGGARDVVLGIPLQNRMGRIARTPSTQVNVLPLHLTLREQAPLADWLAAAGARLAAMRRHGRYRGEALQRELGRIGAGRRLWGPLVNILPFDACPRFHGCDTTLQILSAGSVDDITLCFRGDPESGLLAQVDSNDALYDAAETEAHCARLVRFLANACAARCLADVPTLTPAETRRHVVDRNATAHPVAETTLTALIEAQMAATPDTDAVTFDAQTLSYRALDRQSAALARRLAGRGIGPGDIVAVALPRSLGLIVALVGILRSGAAFLPLDPEDQSARRADMIARAAPAVILAEPGLAAAGAVVMRVHADGPEATPRPCGARDAAYVLFTSGSTGKPKGVVIEHDAIVNRLLWMRDHYGFGPQDRILQKTPATFDVSVWEFFLPLLSGATLVVAPPEAHRDPVALAGLIRAHAITAMHFVPSMLELFLASPASAGLAIPRVFASGEALPRRLAELFHQRIRGALHNLYGPTEAAVDVTFRAARPEGQGGGSIPIGRPVWNTGCYLLDGGGRPVPDGVPGRLFIAGRQLARGYLGQPDLTRERFLPDPFTPGGRMYDTGDLAVSDESGALTFVGRVDHQVKIRGVRVEPAEVEQAMRDSGLAEQVAVTLQGDAAGGARLLAYAVARHGAQASDIRQALMTRLPQAMVPAHIVMLDALPLTPSGKLDRKALPQPDALLAATGRAPQSDMERLVARCYAEVLELAAPPPVETDFFLAGGDSLRAVRLCLLLEEALGQNPGFGAVLERPVLADIARHLEQAAARNDGLGPILHLSAAPNNTPPIFAVHPAGGLAWCYRSLAAALPDRGVIGLQSPLLDPEASRPESLAALARAYVDRAETLAPEGPLVFLGWSLGGIIAQAMGAEAERRGRRVDRVVLLDAYPSDCWRNEPEPDEGQALRALLAIAGYDPDAHRDLDTPAAIMGFLRAEGQALAQLPDAVQGGVIRSVRATNDLVRRHRETPMRAPLFHVAAMRDQAGSTRSAALWKPYAGQVQAMELDCHHPDLIAAPVIRRYVTLLSQPIAEPA